MQQDDKIIELCLYFLNLIKNSSDKKELPSDLMQYPEVIEICQQLRDVREFGLSLKDGRLDYSTGSRGYLVNIFKALQAELKHITWQMKNMANGEYDDRVYFLGEFSESFNIMVDRVESIMEEVRQLTEKYKELSMRDPLTGAHNRNALTRVAQSVIQRVARDKQNSVLLMLDLDFFKKVNDTYGHSAGDAVLCEFVKNIYSTLRFEDICCRYGGEEFLIILPGVALETGKSIAERIRAKIENSPTTYQEQAISVTSSVGGAGLRCEDVFINAEHALTKAIKKADDNLYTAKRNGRNQVCFLAK